MYWPPWCIRGGGPISRETQALIASSWSALLSGRSEAFRAERHRCDNSPVMFFYNTFYHFLFELAPEVKHLFTSGMQGQGRMFAHVLQFLTQHFSDACNFEDTVRKLAVRHNRIGILPEHFNVLGLSLLFALRKCIGPEEFTPACKHAWSRLFGRLCELMLPVTVSGITTNKQLNLRKSACIKTWKPGTCVSVSAPAPAPAHAHAGASEYSKSTPPVNHASNAVSEKEINRFAARLDDEPSTSHSPFPFPFEETATTAKHSSLEAHDEDEEEDDELRREITALSKDCMARGFSFSSAKAPSSRDIASSVSVSVCGGGQTVESAGHAGRRFGTSLTTTGANPIIIPIHNLHSGANPIHNHSGHGLPPAAAAAPPPNKAGQAPPLPAAQLTPRRSLCPSPQSTIALSSSSVAPSSPSVAPSLLSIAPSSQSVVHLHGCSTGPEPRPTLAGCAR